MKHLYGQWPHNQDKNFRGTDRLILYIFTLNRTSDGHRVTIDADDFHIFCNKKNLGGGVSSNPFKKFFAASKRIKLIRKLFLELNQDVSTHKSFFSLSSSRPFEKKIKFEKRWTELRWNELNFFEPEPCSSFQCRARMSRRLSKYPLIPLRAQAFLLIKTNKSKLEPTMNFSEI